VQRAPYATGTTASDGSVTLEPPADYPVAGYVDLSSPDIVPLIFFWTFPLSRSAVSFDIPVLTPLQMSTAAGLLGVTLDPTAGVLTMQAMDCNLTGGQGVQFSVAPTDPDTSPVLYYTKTSRAISLTAGSTDPTGVGFVFNVPATKEIEVTATPQGLGPVQQGDGVRPAGRDGLCGGAAHATVRPAPQLPVDPSPPVPRAVAPISPGASTSSARATGAMTSCAMRSSGASVTGPSLRFTSSTWISPR